MHSKKFSLRSIAPFVYECVSTMVMALLVMVVFFTFLFRVVKVSGSSMENTLRDGEQLLLLTAVSAYQRGDIVVVDRHAEEPLIKRVIALPGDLLEITEDGTVYLNGHRQDESYTVGMTKPLEQNDAMRVPSGYVFVMGDNREHSLDSRSKQIGLIYIKDIVGKAVLRVSPFESFGSVN